MLYKIIRKLSPRGASFESIVFFKLDLATRTHSTLTGEQFLPVEYHVINSTDDKWLHILCDSYPDKEFRARLFPHCHECLIVTLHGNLVAYAWITTSFCHLSEIEFDLPVAPGQLFIYDCFVHPGNRGRGIYSALLLAILAKYTLRGGDESCRVACIGAARDNKASIKGIKRAGFAEYGSITFLRLWRLSRWFGVEKVLQPGA